MKKVLSAISSLISYLFAIPALALAQVVNPRPSGQFGKLQDFTDASFGDIVGTFITFAFILAVLIALAFLVFGGIKWITSGGDKTAVEGARNTIVAAIVGLVIVFLSYFILNIILGLFGLNLKTLNIPQLKP